MRKLQHTLWLLTALQASLLPKNQKARELSRKTSMMRHTISMRKKSAKWQKLKSIDPGGLDFYFITDSSLNKNGIINDVRAAINAGCRIIQYREKNRCTKDMVEDADKIKELCRSKAFFLVNDRVDIALA